MALRWWAGGQVQRSVGKAFLTFDGQDRVCTGTVVQDSCSGSVNSVTSFRYAAGPLHEYLFGPYFDAATRRAYVAGQSSSTNLIVD